MPTFDFICEKCGYKTEQLVRMNYPKISLCPKCKQNSLIRCIGSGSGFIFKGEGFYENYKKTKDAIKENQQMNQERNQRTNEDPDF